MFDLIIRNGRIVDGTGAPWFPGDLAIKGERISALGSLPRVQGVQEIDATGKIVCPGFIDCHSHSDRSILINREATSSIYQGVTTEIVGNCGKGFAPISETSKDMMVEGIIHAFCPGLLVDWSSHNELLDRVSEGIGINLAYLVAHEPIRKAVMGMDLRPPRANELIAMERLLAESLDGGGIGISFGLEFMPGRIADREELLHLCKVAARYQKLSTWHIRNRDRRFEEAVDEALDIGRAAGVSVQLSHLSSKPGAAPRSWNRAMESVRLARAQGLDVCSDMIPYTVGPGRLSTILPTWATEGTTAQVQRRLRDPEIRKRLGAESDRYWLLFYQREFDKVTLSHCHSHPEWIGMSFYEIGQETGKDPFDCVYDILADEGDGIATVGMNGVLFSDGDIVEWLSDPLFSICSDGISAQDHGYLAQLVNHPNCFGWTPRVIQYYVGELRIMPLEEAIRKMTSMPAARFSLSDRGILRPGMAADVVIFDQDRFKSRATYLTPHVYAEGMETVLVNGSLAMDRGVPTGTMNGRVLRR